MATDDDGGPGVLDLIIAEWPAALAVLVLVVGHLYLLLVEGRDLTPLDIPLFLAIAVFILGELGRRIV